MGCQEQYLILLQPLPLPLSLVPAEYDQRGITIEGWWSLFEPLALAFQPSRA